MTYCTFYEVRMAMGCNWAPKERLAFHQPAVVDSAATAVAPYNPGSEICSTVNS